MKEQIIEVLEADRADREAHSYNHYHDDSERIITLTVEQIEWLIEELS